MRRSALLGLTLSLPVLLAGCDGAGTYLGDTFTFPGSNPNLPLGNSENARRVLGEQVGVGPVLPEPGDIWPGPPPPVPSLSDIEKLDNENPANPPAQTTPDLPDHRQPRGSSTPPGNNQPGLPPLANPPVMPPFTPVTPAPGQPRTGTTVQTPRGPSTITGGTNNYRTTTPPGGVGGGQGILIPNGNGTSTLIGPDGSVTTVPTPK